MATPFLTARWLNLCLVTYGVPPKVLARYVPPGLDLDLRDGMAFVSLVAFEFQDTRVLGIRWPSYVNFPELNLRFYVRHGAQRGVVFIREYVRQTLIKNMARWTYNERYLTAPLVHDVRIEGDRVAAECRVPQGEKSSAIHVVGRNRPYRPAQDSMEWFFKEHQWGFNVDRKGHTIRYEVQHPEWDVYPVESHAIAIDWNGLYGPEWKFLADQQPDSVVFALGSDVKVFWKKRL